MTSFQRMEMFVEFKRGDTSDPFHAKGQKSFEKLHETTCTTRGQIVLYSTVLQTYQFRTWVFSIGIFGNVARLFRWDRAGAIVSEPISFTDRQNCDLEEFLYRFDKMTPVQRGFDPTVVDATQEEAVAFDNTIQSTVENGNVALMKGLFDSVGDGVKYLRRKIEILDGKDKAGKAKAESYIIGQPIATANSATGRATRGFVAMSTKDQRLVFLKDSWRPDLPGMMGEGHWFEKLKGARNISAFTHGSDVRSAVMEGIDAGESDPPEGRFQHTHTNLHAKDYGKPENTIGYIHYRTVQCEFYVPLRMFKHSNHLVRIMLDIAKGTSWLSSTS
jgi:hypothetical protein